MGLFDLWCLSLSNGRPWIQCSNRPIACGLRKTTDNFNAWKGRTELRPTSWLNYYFHFTRFFQVGEQYASWFYFLIWNSVTNMKKIWCLINQATFLPQPWKINLYFHNYFELHSTLVESSLVTTNSDHVCSHLSFFCLVTNRTES